MQAGVVEKVKSLLGWLRKRWWLVLGIILIGAGGWWFGIRKTEKVVETARVERRVIRETVNASGTVKAGKDVTLKFLAPSKVTWVGVTEGDQVKTWQGVAAVDRRQLEKSLQLKLSEFMGTRWDFEQTQDNYDVGGRRYELVENLTDEERRILEKSQFGLDQAVLGVEIADLAEKEAVLVTPISGTVVEVANLENWVNLTGADVNTSYVRIVDLDTLYFEAEVDEVDYANVAVGQVAEVDLDAFDDVLRGKVIRVGRQGVKSTSGVVNVLAEIELENKPENLVTGLNGEVNITVAESQPVLAVAKQFVEFLPEKTVVKVRDANNRLMDKEVTTGLVTMDWVEIVGGLNEGEEVVVVE